MSRLERVLFEQTESGKGLQTVFAVKSDDVLEEVAKMAYRCEHLNPEAKPAPQYLQDKHFFRKHGANAYYGQGK